MCTSPTSRRKTFSSINRQLRKQSKFKPHINELHRQWHLEKSFASNCRRTYHQLVHLYYLKKGKQRVHVTISLKYNFFDGFWNVLLNGNSVK